MDDPPASPGRPIADLARAALDRRLERNAAAPLVVAFSGGGDSLALLIAAKAWADAAGRRLLAVTVDHRLQEAGAAWAAWCQARCQGLGIAHQTAVWEGDKPATGVAAAARAARHGLIAQAARAVGARVVLMGHTADDRLESNFMRAAGTGVADPAEWAPSPVWPEGRGVFILRPLLAARRADIRRALTAAGETWIDDPANLDPRQPRGRARIVLAGGGEIERGAPPPRCAFLLAHVIAGPAGDLALPREVLRAAPAGATRALIGAALL
ncbi:MAG: tRNA lysidine(34) synthetase TilS, partial [Caulobacteraceae bacterium]